MKRFNANEAARRLGIEHPIVQGPFGGGLSTVVLASTVANLGGLGSFGAHMLAPERIGGVADEIRALTDKPFALNLWISDHDAGGDRIDAESFERGWRLFAPYFRELGIDKHGRRQPNAGTLASMSRSTHCWRPGRRSSASCLESRRKPCSPNAAVATS